MNSAVVLEAAIIKSLEALRSLLRGKKSPHHLTPSMYTTIQAWRVSEAMQSPLTHTHTFSLHTPLCPSFFHYRRPTGLG